MAVRRLGHAEVRLGVLVALVGLALAVSLVAPRAALADGSHLSVDFAAARPTTYDHATGEGGTFTDVVESLEGGDFACGDIVVFFAAIGVDPAEREEHTVELDFDFLGQPTGADGVGFVDIVSASANTGDSAHVTDGDEVVSILTQAGGHPDGDVTGTIQITNLGVGDTRFILRIEADLGCTPGQDPTGNLQASLDAGRVTSPVPDTINTGRQTIPFRHAGDIAFPSAPPPCPAPSPGAQQPLQITNTPSTRRPKLGVPFDYRIGVCNGGTGSGTDVLITDKLPAPEEPVSAKPSQGSCSGRRVVTCDLGDLDPGASATVTVRVVPTRAGQVRNAASADSAESPAIRATATVRVTMPATTMRLTKRARSHIVPAGQRVTFDITLRADARAIQDATLCDTLPAGLSVVSAPGARFRDGRPCWSWRYLARRAVKRVRVIVRVAPGITARRLTNRASAHADNARRRAASAAVRVLPRPPRGGGVTG